jgi:secondary thiamine-phosphate synthase enzyme
MVSGSWKREAGSPTSQNPCLWECRDGFAIGSWPQMPLHQPRMKSLTEHLWFEVPQRRGFVNITRTVEDLVRKSGVKEGLCLVNAMHITASVFINDNESGLHHDYDVWLEKLAPHEPTSQYHHNRTGEDNADAHLKRQIMGREVVVAITNGKLDFGPWEQIFYGEFDGRRRKRVLVKIIGE